MSLPTHKALQRDIAENLKTTAGKVIKHPKPYRLQMFMK
jgi:hypothetical protein